MTRPLDLERRDGLVRRALELGVVALAAELRRTGQPGGLELLALQSLVRTRQSTTRVACELDDADGGDMEPVSVNYDAAGRMLGVSARTVQRLVASGELRAVKVGGARRVPVTEIRGLVDREFQDAS